MPRLPLHPSSGTGIIPLGRKRIRFVRYGCANRPFFHIVVMNRLQEQRKPPIEQLGTYDPFPNMYNEKLCSFNFERIQYWLGKGAELSKPVAQLLGLAGFLPIHPRTYMAAWRNRRQAEKEEAAKESEETKEQSVG